MRKAILRVIALSLPLVIVGAYRAGFKRAGSPVPLQLKDMCDG